MIASGDASEGEMQETNRGQRTARARQQRPLQRRILEVGGSADDGRAIRRTLDGKTIRVAARTKGLLEALRRLEDGAIDIVLLDCQCREEELQLFALHAQRIGFTGPIFHLVSRPGTAPETIEDHAARGEASTGEAHHVPLDNPVQEALYGTLQFTQRERSVLRRVVDGWTSRQIARSLKCTEGSVKAVLQQIFKKLGVRRRSLLVRMALEGTLGEAYKKSHSSLHAPQLMPLSPPPLPAPPPPSTDGHEQPIHVGDFTIDIAMRRVWVRGTEVQFSPTEFELLKCFSQHPDELLRHENILAMLWGNPAAARESLRVLIRTLRMKIETTKTPRYIVTQHNFGYRFNPQPKDSQSK